MDHAHSLGAASVSGRNITFWDTANVDGYGTSEEIVGRAITRYSRREEIVLATDAVAQVAEQRGIPMAPVAMAWVLKNPVVAAPIVGPTKPHHLSDAAAALEIRLSDDEIRTLEEPYTPRLPTGF